MEFDFFHQQPHPETDASACTWLLPDAKALTAITPDPACAAAGAYAQGQFYAAIVRQDAPTAVDLWRGSTIETLAFLCSLPFTSPIKQVSLAQDKDRLLLAVHTEHLILLDVARKQEIARLDTSANSAVLSMLENERFLVEDGTITLLDDQWKALAQSTVRAGSTAGDAYPLKRMDALEKEGRTNPGTLGGMLFAYHGSLYYACGDLFHRCAQAHTDTFLCKAEQWNAPFSRRYLAIPGGGAASFFTDDAENLYACIIGDAYSTVQGQAAIVPMELTNGFLRPARTCITESTLTASFQPLPMTQHIRDTFVYTCPDGWYYITGTTQSTGSYWSGTSGIRLWRTQDFISFQDYGVVYNYAEDPDCWQMQLKQTHNAWAPEIVFYQDTFWITYSTAPGCGLLKSLSGKPEGPYQDMGRVVMRGIDSGFFEENGQMYLIWQNGLIAPFNQDMTSFTQEPVLLLPTDGQQVGYEGAGLIRVGDQYILYAAEWNGDERMDGTYDMMYSTASNLYGPYSPRKLLVPHGGHGSLFFNRAGELCFSMFGNDRTAAFRHAVGIARVEERWGRCPQAPA